MKHRKIILSILIIVWMATIFMFSNQWSQKSSNVSGKTIRFILDKLSITENMDKVQIDKLVEKLQTPIRKLAHFSIYALGGIISFIFINEYNLKHGKKLLFALAICVIYAIVDEIHQYFIPGRSCEIRDVLIDSTGAILGIFISNLFIKIHKCISTKNLQY